MAVGERSKIKAVSVLVDPKKSILGEEHAKEFRFASSDRKIASVSRNGSIKAKAKGTCYVYVYAVNGYAKRVKVTVE